MRRKPKCRKPKKVVTVRCKKNLTKLILCNDQTIMFFTAKPENAVNWMQKYGNPRKLKANIPTFLIFYQLNKSSEDIFPMIL